MKPKFNTIHIIFLIVITLNYASISSGRLNVQIDGGSENGLFVFFPENESNDTYFSSPDLSYFVPLLNSKSLQIRASFGPIESRETIHIPGHHRIPPSSFKEQIISNEPKSKEENDFRPKTLASGSDGQRLASDLIAHIVNREISRTNPVLRVLFYTAYFSFSELGVERTSKNEVSSDSMCLVVSLFKGREKFFGSCSPIKEHEGACLVEITLPSYWWPAIRLDTDLLSKKSSQASVEYKIFKGIQCGDGFLTGILENTKSVLSFNSLGAVTLLPDIDGYEELTDDDMVRILIPRGRIYPNSRVFIPVCFKRNPNYPIASFRVKAKVKNGLQILDAQPSSPSLWQINTEINNKQTSATVIATFKEDQMLADSKIRDDSGESDENYDYQADVTEPESRPSQEIYSFLIQVDSKADLSEVGRIVWQIDYLKDANQEFSKSSDKKLDPASSKPVSRLNIQKDETQAVFGLTRSISLINTAVLTGKQISRQLKIFRVSFAGHIGDITLQSSCSSNDETIIKVSPSCTSVYLDGSEIRGSFNATIRIKYGDYSGQANFIVWMPKFPLDVRISDAKLSQIKGWKTPHLKHQASIHRRNVDDSTAKPSSHSRKLPQSSSEKYPNDESTFVENEIGCRLRYQQGYIQVLAQFFTTDQNSGREFYFLNRKALLSVTDLVIPHLRVSDPKVAFIRGDIVEGLSNGNAFVQVVSPIRNEVLGMKSIRVTNEKESITRLEVIPISNLRVQVNFIPEMNNVWQVKTSISGKIFRQYGQSFLDIRVLFSDQTAVSLYDFTQSDYHLSIQSPENGAVVYDTLIDKPYPRFIAINQGKEQIHISLEVSNQCQKKKTQSLASAYCSLEVDFNSPPTNLQNDADFRKFSSITLSRNFSSTQLQELDFSLSALNHDSNFHLDSKDNAPYIKARRNKLLLSAELTPLEFGMYALLFIFTIAASLFVLSCLIFRYKVKKPQELSVTTVPLDGRHHSTSFTQRLVATAGDWIWLGRNAFEASARGSASDPTVNTDSGTLVLTSGNPILSSDKVATDIKRNSTISYPGSEISIRITNNPVNDCPVEDVRPCGTPRPSSQFGNQNEVYKSSVLPTSAHLTNPPPIPARRTTRTQSNNVCSSHQNGLTSDPLIIPSHNPPHIPPRHTNHIRLGKNVSNPTPPPVPPHKNLNRKRPSVPPHRTIPYKLNKSSEPAGVVTTLCSERERESSVDANKVDQNTWNRVTKNMNQRELVEYFQNLKESSA